jgi:two-component system, cell cycle response regulator DivK
MTRRHSRNIPSRPLVLIVDDHDDTRELYLESLAALGFEAIAAADRANACQRAWESHPDIVVTDLTLPGGDGWQLIQDLKRQARTRDIPIVLLTGHEAPSLRERAEREGCAAFFVKLCLPDELAIELRHVLDRPLLMNASRHYADGDTRPCPQCRNTLVFSSRYPVLAVGALGRSGSEVGDHIRYERVCRNGGCDYRELVGVG